LTAREHGP